MRPSDDATTGPRKPCHTPNCKGRRVGDLNRCRSCLGRLRASPDYQHFLGPEIHVPWATPALPIDDGPERAYRRPKDT